MYEQKLHPLLTRTEFLWRVVRHTALALLAVLVVLLVGTAGYHYLGKQHVIDAFLSAAMILGGMGPVGELADSVPAKLFSAGYALFSGLFFIALMGILLLPFAHRLLHHFHMEDEEPDSGDE